MNPDPVLSVARTPLSTLGARSVWTGPTKISLRVFVLLTRLIGSRLRSGLHALVLLLTCNPSEHLLIMNHVLACLLHRMVVLSNPLGSRHQVKKLVVLLSKSILHSLLSLLRSVLAVHLPSRIESVQLQHHRNVRMNALHVLYLLLKNDYPTHLMTELLFLMFLVFASAMIGLVL